MMRTMGGGERKKILVGLAVAMFLGVAVYLRLWTIDYSFSSDDSEILRFFFPFCVFFALWVLLPNLSFFLFGLFNV